MVSGINLFKLTDTLRAEISNDLNYLETFNVYQLSNEDVRVVLTYKDGAQVAVDLKLELDEELKKVKSIKCESCESSCIHELIAFYLYFAIDLRMDYFDTYDPDEAIKMLKVFITLSHDELLTYALYLAVSEDAELPYAVSVLDDIGVTETNDREYLLDLVPEYDDYDIFDDEDIYDEDEEDEEDEDLAENPNELIDKTFRYFDSVLRLKIGEDISVDNFFILLKEEMVPMLIMFNDKLYDVGSEELIKENRKRIKKVIKYAEKYGDEANEFVQAGIIEDLILLAISEEKYANEIFKVLENHLNGTEYLKKHQKKAAYQNAHDTDDERYAQILKKIRKHFGL